MKTKITFRKLPLVRALVLAGVSLGSCIALASPAVVSNGNNDGEGSLRAALEAGAREVVLATAEDILITETLSYDAEKPLAIYGWGQTVRTTEDITLLEIANGASLTVIGLNFEGPGGFDIENQSVNGAAGAGKGIFIDLRDDQDKQVKMVLRDVTVKGVANHGVHISDCDLADDCGGGGGGAGGGSPAGVRVELTNVTIEDVGNGKFDADGLRVDERGDGNIAFVADNVTVTNVGADGVELDEGQSGDVIALVSNSRFSDNGGYCDPQLLASALPEPSEGEGLEDGALSVADITPVDTPDDRCFEVEFDTYPSGSVSEYEVAIDVDDGFDIDEAGKGSLRARIVNSDIRNNLDEGVDFDEEDNGAIALVALNSVASGNTDDGFKLSEADNGQVDALLVGVQAIGNGGKGVVLEEAGRGRLTALLNATQTADNDAGETGVEAVQEDQGYGRLTLKDATIMEVPGIETEGVEVVQD